MYQLRPSPSVPAVHPNPLADLVQRYRLANPTTAGRPYSRATIEPRVLSCSVVGQLFRVAFGQFTLHINIFVPGVLIHYHELSHHAHILMF